jgi:hypothetical protein
MRAYNVDEIDYRMVMEALFVLFIGKKKIFSFSFFVLIKLKTGKRGP